MKPVISSAYHAKRGELSEAIRAGDIKVIGLEESDHIYRCYFCGERIEGKTHILIESSWIRGRVCTSRYFLDDDCYQDARM